MDKKKRIAFTFLGSFMLLLIGAAMVYGGLNASDPIETTVVEAPERSNPRDTFVEFIWEGETVTKILRSENNQTIGSDIQIAEPSSISRIYVEEYKDNNLAFALAGMATIAIAIGLIAFAFIFDPENYRKRKILQPAQDLVAQPSTHWLFFHTTIRQNYVNTYVYSLVVVAGMEVIVGNLRDTTQVTEAVIKELGQTNKLKPYIDGLKNKTIKGPYKKSFGEVFTAQSITQITLTDDGASMYTQDGAIHNFQIPGKTVQEKYHVAQSLINQLLPGITPVLENKHKKLGKDTQLLHFKKPGGRGGYEI